MESLLGSSFGPVGTLAETRLKKTRLNRIEKSQPTNKVVYSTSAHFFTRYFHFLLELAMLIPAVYVV